MSFAFLNFVGFFFNLKIDISSYHLYLDWRM